jgi:hypothetical protein
MAEKKFAFIVEDEVFMVFVIDPDLPNDQNAKMVYAGLSSDPKVISIPDDQEVIPLKTKWNGTEFYRVGE